MTTSFWKEIKADFMEVGFDSKIDRDISAIISIDAYKTNKPNEEGHVIAKVILSEHGDVCVIYFDSVARTDKYAQEIIAGTIATIKTNTGHKEVA